MSRGFAIVAALEHAYTIYITHGVLHARGRHGHAWDSGLSCACLEQGCQFTADGMVRLPPFQIPASILQSGGDSSDGAPEVPGPLLNPADLHLLNMGQQMYCAHLNRSRQILSLYHFYKCALTSFQ